jgi:hypothetical protein
MMHTDQRMFFAGIPTRPDVEKLISKFGIPEEGRLFRWDEISETIDIDRIKQASRFRTVCEMWRKRLEREHNIILISESGVGLIAATPHDRVVVSGQKIKRSIRGLGKAERVLVTTDRARLNEDDKREYDFKIRLVATLRLTANTEVKRLPKGE